MIGMEEKRDNDLFFVCSVIEYIGRITKNTHGYVVECLGAKAIQRLLDFADVFHCEPIENTAIPLIEEHNIETGDFDNVLKCKYSVPTHFDIAKVYKRLILAAADEEKLDLAEALEQVYGSEIAGKIDDYNSSMYYENPDYIFKSYQAGYPLA